MNQDLTIPGRHDRVIDACQFVVAGARQVGFDEDELSRIELACHEACTNVIQHAYGGRDDGELEIHCWREKNKFVVTLTDRGRPFDPSQAPPPDLSSDWEDRPIGGLGVFLIQQLMDAMKYEYDLDRGNVLWMVKNLPPSSEAGGNQVSADEENSDGAE